MKEKNENAEITGSEGENYFRALVNAEESSILANLHAVLEMDSDESKELLGPLLERLSLIMATISARTSVIEQALERHITPVNLMGQKYLLGEVKISAADVADERQFHKLEVAKAGGRFAWTKKKDIVFHLPLARFKRKRLTLVAVAIVDSEFAKKFVCTVDGQTLTCKTEAANGEIRVHVDLPESEDLGITEVMFSLPEVRAPGGTSEDVRMLGFAFKELGVTSTGRGLFSGKL